VCCSCSKYFIKMGRALIFICFLLVAFYHLANCKPTPETEKPTATSGTNGTVESGNANETSPDGRHLINIDWHILDFSSGKNNKPAEVKNALPPGYPPPPEKDFNDRLHEELTWDNIFGSTR